MIQDIHIKFGNKMTKSSVIVITAIFITIPLFILYPVRELFLFHLLLIKKGITTYDYIMAMRAQMEENNKSSTIESNALDITPKKKNLVKISPWQLAKLDS
jgi:palmitoyltransferase